MTDTSRSGQDFAEVCWMIEAGYSFDDIEREMELFGTSKWNSEGMHYKLTTYKNALMKIYCKDEERGDIF